MNLIKNKYSINKNYKIKRKILKFKLDKIIQMRMET